MKSYPHSRDVAGSFIVVCTIDVSTAEGLLDQLDIRNEDLALADLCPWLVKALTPGLSGDPTDEQIDAAKAAFYERAILRSVEAVLISGPTTQLAYVADPSLDEENVLLGYTVIETDGAEGVITASGDVPVRGLNWPNIAEEHVFYWGTNGAGEATLELTIGIDVMPDPDSSTARLLRT